MNCRECQRDMSPCLDGRLPSGRRSVVMQHLKTCEECNQLWGEFQRAQELVLRLPVRGVGPDFHQRLWDRIKAGEGSPEAVFREPMPWLTKSRYVFTGAAAVALLLVMLNGWFPGTRQGSLLEDSELITGLTPTPVSESKPLVPAMLAQEAAKAVARDYRTLNLSLRRLEQLPPDRLDESTLRIICDSAGAVKDVARFLLWMHRSQHLGLPREMEFKLRFAESSLDVSKLKLIRNPQELTDTLSPVIVQLRSLELLPRQIMVRPVYAWEEQHEFEMRIGELLRQDREFLEYLHIQFPGQSALLFPKLELSNGNLGNRSTVRPRFFFGRIERVFFAPTPKTGK